LIGQEIQEEMVRVMRQESRHDEIARPGGRAAVIAESWERVALAERLLREARGDEALERAELARREHAELLAEWERNAVGGAPCMRIAPWKGNVYDGD
jgi:hypothetical protein